MIRNVDHNALRTNQSFIIGLLLIAFITDLAPIVGFVSVVMIVGAVFPPVRLFVLIYKHILKPVGLVKPDIIPDNPEPHRFSMALGGIVTGLSTLALLGGLSGLGWGLSLLVIGLAALNLFAGFCAGCFMYYQFNKLGVPGFDRAPVQEGA